MTMRVSPIALVSPPMKQVIDWLLFLTVTGTVDPRGRCSIA